VWILLGSLSSGETCRWDHGTSRNTRHLSQIGWNFSEHGRDLSWFGLDIDSIWESRHQLRQPDTLSIQESVETYYSSQASQPLLRSFGPTLFSRYNSSKLVNLCLLKSGGSNLLRSFYITALMEREICVFALPQGAWSGSSASRNQATLQFSRHFHIGRGDPPKWNRIHIWSFNDFYVGARHLSCTLCSSYLSHGFEISGNCSSSIHSLFGLYHMYTFACNQMRSNTMIIKGSPFWILINYYIIHNKDSSMY